MAIIVNVNSQQAFDAGYHMLSYRQRKPVHAWDKALYYFARLSPTRYRFVWLLEDDVLVPSVHTFSAVHIRAQEQSNDLVVASNVVEYSPHNATWKHWHVVEKTLRLPLPWYASIVCAMGLSDKVLAKVDNYAAENKRLDFLEAFFNTLTVHASLSLWQAPALATLGLGMVRCSDVTERPDHWFHPVKKQAEFLSQCSQAGHGWAVPNEKILT